MHSAQCLPLAAMVSTNLLPTTALGNAVVFTQTKDTTVQMAVRPLQCVSVATNPASVAAGGPLLPRLRFVFDDETELTVTPRASIERYIVTGHQGIKSITVSQGTSGAVVTTVWIEELSEHERKALCGG